MRVLVFGTFDGLHEGHKAYLTQAKTFGDTIVASVPDDKTVHALKRKLPKQSFEERKTALLASGLVQEVFVSDNTQGGYNVLDRAQPDTILVGYDQREIEQSLQKHPSQIPVHRAQPFHPDIYKSSLL